MVKLVSFYKRQSQTKQKAHLQMNTKYRFFFKEHILRYKIRKIDYNHNNQKWNVYFLLKPIFFYQNPRIYIFFAFKQHFCLFREVIPVSGQVFELLQILFEGKSQFQLPKCSIQQIIMNHISQNFYLNKRPMANIKKVTRCTRSREDYDLFKITYPHYDPQTLRTIQLHLGPGQYVRSGASIATVHLQKMPSETLQKQGEALQKFSLTTYVAGKIQKIGSNFTAGKTGWKLRQEVKKGSVELLQIRQCQHIINNQSITNSNITTRFDNSTAFDMCPNCGKQIWIYYQNQEQTITIQTLLAANPHLPLQNLDDLEWNIIVNEQFTPSTAIAKVKEKELKLPILAKPTYLVKEGEKPVNNVIMKICRAVCKHEKIVDNRCMFCLQIRESSQMQQYPRYLFQLGPNGVGKAFAKGSALLHQEQQYINSLLNSRKLILILDLDNTILHSNEMNQLEPSDLMKLQDFFLLSKNQQLAQGKVKQDYVVVKIRPYLKQFLSVVARMFQVYIYTKGTRIYADGICRWVRHQWAGQPSPCDLNTWSQPPLKFLKNTQCFAPHRVISRNEDTNLETKSMQNILPSRTQYHLILDDRRDVWGNSPSWFFTREYYYFMKRKRNPNQMTQSNEQSVEEKEPQNILAYQKKLMECYKEVRQNYPQKSEIKVDISDRPDYFLLFAAVSLRKIHHGFFDQFKNTNDEKNQPLKGSKPKEEKKPVISLAYVLQLMKSFLKCKSVRFFTTPNDQSLSTARRALKLGATLLTTKQKPDYVIRGNNYMRFIKKWRLEQMNSKQNEKIEEPPKPTIPQSQVKVQMLKEDISAIQKMSLEQQIEQKTQKIPQQKQQANIDSQANKKSRLDRQIQKQIKEPKADYDSELRELGELHKQGVPVIAETWILACYEFTYRFKSADFRLQDPFKEDVQHSHFDHCITKVAEVIRSEINEHLARSPAPPQTQKKKMKEKREPSSGGSSKKERPTPTKSEKMQVKVQKEKAESLSKEQSK